MLVQPGDLVRSLEGRGGAAFEAFLHDLLALEARSAGLPPTAIGWDQRTNVPDGGRDICVYEGVTATTSLIPSSASIWSAKAGEDGRKPATLKAEVEAHAAVKEHIAEGKAFRYVVLQDCSQDQREALLGKARELCDAQSVDHGTIQVVFNDQLAQCTSRCPTLIPHHLPDLRQRLGTGAAAPRIWIADVQKEATPYTPLAGRDPVAEKLGRLLAGDAGLRYVHIAGWSGIGKSRLVAEVLRASDAQDLAVVYPVWSDFETGLLPALRSGQVEAATVVIDDVDIAQVATLMKLCERRPGLRMISLGASELRQRLPQACEFLERPSSQDLGAIVRARASYAIGEAAVRRITDLADGDVRFAELLTDAAEEAEAFDGAPGRLIEALRDLDTIVEHYFARHRNSIGDAAEFRRSLAIVTLLAEVGIKGGREDELEALAKYCKKHAPDLRTVIADGERIGVCQRIGDFVECIPRPLATHVFERHAWPIIVDDLLNFFSSLPSERSRRSFLRRVVYCRSLQREEVEKSLGDMFRDRFSDADLSTLADPDLARTLRSLVEVVPQRGLAWLRRLIESATIEELLEFPGSTSTFGPTYGRREVVWLCEHLRCFADCFAHAEAILFRLALAETEQLGNNATAEWQQCFWWQLSGTEVPLEERIDILIGRLRQAAPETIPLLLKGAIAALHEPVAATAPPEFVGGRTTPPEWRPKTWGEVFSQWDRVIAELIALSQSAALRDSVVDGIIGDLELFVRRGLPDGLRDVALDPARLSDAQLRSLREALDRLAGPYNRLADEVKVEIAEWRTAVAPRSLPEQIREVVGRDTWSHERDDRGPDSWRRPYEALVGPIAEDPGVLSDLREWLASGEAKSPRALAAALGRDVRSRDAVKGVVVEWLTSGECLEFVIGFFLGAAGDDRKLPAWALEALSRASSEQPDSVVHITVEADVAPRGVERVLSLLPSCGSPPSALLSRLFGHHWERVLTPQDKRAVLERLLEARRDEHAVACGLHLLTMWYFRKEDDIDVELDDVVGRLAKAVVAGGASRRTHEWETAMRWWSQRHPEEASRILVQVMTSLQPRRLDLAREAEKLLVAMARRFPDAVAAALREAIADERSRVAFHFSEFRGLFEELGMERVRAMIAQLGEDGASAIARHLPDPGATTAAELVDWFLREYAHNERVFTSYLCGRHSGKVTMGYAFQRRDAVYEGTARFIGSDNPGIRKWAEWERAEIDRDAERDRKMVDEMGRE